MRRVSEVVGVRLETILRGDTRSRCLVLSLVLLGFGHHALDLLLGKTALVVGDGDAGGFAGGLVGGGDVEDSVGVDIECYFDLRDTSGCGGDTGKLELAEEVVVLRSGTFTLVHLDEHTGLVVGVRGEGLGSLGGDGGVSLDKSSHDTTSGLDTSGEGSDIEEEDVLGLLGRVTAQDSSLDSGTVSDGLIGVDALVGLLAVEEVGDELDDAGNTGGATNEDDLVHVGLVDLGVAEDLLDGLEGAAEEVLAELLETGTGEGGVEIDTLE